MHLPALAPILEGMSKSRNPPVGRLARLGKVAALSARGSAGLAVRALRKVAGSDTQETERSTIGHFVQVLGEMKGAAMKLGQALSMEVDALPPELRQLVARLQSEAPPIASEEIASIIEEELGAPPERLFAEFDPKPLAAASLGQVHAARLEDGREVVLKVQYPGIADALDSDFSNLSVVARAAGLTSKLFDGRDYVEELRREISLETDYLLEAERARAFHALLAPEGDLLAPEPIPERSSSRVLCLTRVRGQTLQRFIDSNPDAEARWRVSEQLIRAVHGPFFSAARIHADPHPGNFLVTEDGRLALLDFGCVKSFRPDFVEAIRAFMRSEVRGEAYEPLAGVRAAGFEVELDEAIARSLLAETVEIATRPLRTSCYDYARDTSVPDMRALGLRRTLDFLRIRPPAEAVMLGRAVGGCAQNLRALGARGDFRSVYARLLERMAPRVAQEARSQG
ncbi:putative unusual protein kinase regulating ubiquinone biosynthesis (AarF/ABC1/UbiB family) [Archangium gephyra]|uniref:Unusual protein kinase regulating ubiquinone biosynthesis (AarF/ABC1/UbiB family) n=2 Tax=Archangium gephyra TaxID=48 RepID=A0ABX9JVU2_9BACT|nr:putative unusual protein kinase regulating ubiquinone biosynthesis (AarF/ABC1/UbiB family) [Archangium gephyra]